MIAENVAGFGVHFEAATLSFSPTEVEPFALEFSSPSSIKTGAPWRVFHRFFAPDSAAAFAAASRFQCSRHIARCATMSLFVSNAGELGPSWFAGAASSANSKKVETRLENQEKGG
jgi:hypothetical protein